MHEECRLPTLAGKRILYIQYTNPAGYPPLEHSSRLLADAGWQVLFLGTGAAGSANQLNFPTHPNIRVRQLSFCPAGWRQKLHYIRFLIWVFAWVLRWRPHWVYVSELLSCPAAWLVSFLPGRQVVYHEHDPPQQEPTSRFQRWCLATRRRLAKRAVACVLPNAIRMQRFREETGADSVFCVWNCPTRDEVGTSRPVVVGQDVWLLYHGSITPPQLPITVLDALVLLPDRVKLRVLGYETVGHGSYVSEMREKARNLGLTERVQFMGSVPTRRELLSWCGRSDVGLALFVKRGLRPMAGASNKPFDYIASGLPLLVPDLPDWNEMYVKPGYGLACDPDDPESIANALRWFLDHPEQMRAMGEAGRQRILTEWNYETQFRPVWRMLCERPIYR